MNKFDFSPIQIAAIKCHKSCLVTLIKYGDSESLLSLSSCKETLLHLACRGIWSKLLEMKDDMNAELSRERHHRVTGRSENVCKELEARQKMREEMLMQQTTPVLEILLEALKVR